MRFHPSKRFSLAVSSYSGAVNILDIQSKKKLFFEKNAHSAPCRDLSMTVSSPDVFVSCGYDCNLNVYDIRKRGMVQQLNQPYPLSTVCLSSCGIFCCAGNLKGDVISFDFRNLKAPLDTKRCYDDGVVRVAFIPTTADGNKMLDKLSDTMNTTNLTTSLPQPVLKAGAETDSFIKFVDLCHVNNNVERKASCGNRDSFFDIVSPNKFHDFSTDSVAITPSRLSLSSVPDYSELRFKRLSRISINNSVLSDIVTQKRDSILADTDSVIQEQDDMPNTKSNNESNICKRIKRESMDLAKRNRKSDLCEIEEENTTPSNIDKSDFKLDFQPDRSVSFNKENRQNNHQDIEKFAKSIKNSQISTPNVHPIKPVKADFLSNDNLRKLISDVIDEKLLDFQSSIKNAITESSNAIKTHISTSSEAILKKVHETENEIKYYQDNYYHSGFGDNFRLFKLMEKEIDILKEGMGLLVRGDSIAQEYYRLQAENEELRKRLEKQ